MSLVNKEELAKKIWELETKCQNNPDQQSEILKEMDNIASSLSVADLFEIGYIIETKYQEKS